MTRCHAAAVLAIAAAASAGIRAQPADRSELRSALESAASLLERSYVFPETGRTLAARLRAEAKSDRGATHDARAVAARITEDLQRLSGDGHLRLEYVSDPAAGESAADSAFEAAERERYYGSHLNFGFERVERLDGNIGVLDLRVFAPVAMGGDTAAAAMQWLAHTDALVVDLRRNGGGDGEMSALLISYLISGQRPLSGFYSRPKNETTQAWTLSYVPGPRYGDRKPVYVVTSRKTFSAAESFAYDLQALQRATVVGEPTGGGAHPFAYERLTPHWVLWLVTGRSINPITKGNWAGKGVQPDVVAPAERAVDIAIGLARKALGR